MKLVKRNTSILFDKDAIISDFNIYGRKIKQTQTREYTTNGLFSAEIFGNIDAQQNEYRCKCGHLEGKVYDGEICPKCKEKVTMVSHNIKKNGWIDISGNKYDENGNIIKTGKGYKIIKIIPYLQLEKIIKPKILRLIIQTKNVIDINGDIDTAALEEERNETEENKYIYIGLIEFYEKYNEVLDYYYNLCKTKNEAAYNFVKNKDEVFSDKICVISPLLRPAVRTATGIKLDQINKYYTNIIKSNFILNNNTVINELNENIQLTMIQVDYFRLCQYTIGLLSGKQGLIRNNICGTRINFCGRNIITPAEPELKLDEVAIPYITFANLYKFEIINLYKKIKKCTLKEATRLWFNATLKFDDEMYTLMMKIVKENKIGILLNRNPTINYGSIMYLNVALIKKNFNDLTCSISNNILVPQAADYDGDTLNIISLKDAETRDKFEKVFSPINMLISSNSAKWNSGFTFQHDIMLGLDLLIK